MTHSTPITAITWGPAPQPRPSRRARFWALLRWKRLVLVPQNPALQVFVGDKWVDVEGPLAMKPGVFYTARSRPQPDIWTEVPR